MAFSKRGRKRGLLTSRKRDVFLQALREGARRPQAAIVAGISPRTIEEWWQRGKGMLTTKPTYQAHIDFVHDVEMAEAQAEMKALQAVTGGFRRDPRLAVWYLENRSPDWRQRQLPATAPQPLQITAGGSTQIIVTDVETMRRIGYSKIGEVSGPSADERAGLVEDTGG